MGAENLWGGGSLLVFEDAEMMILRLCVHPQTCRYAWVVDGALPRAIVFRWYGVYRQEGQILL